MFFFFFYVVSLCLLENKSRGCPDGLGLLLLLRRVGSPRLSKGLSSSIIYLGCVETFWVIFQYFSKRLNKYESYYRSDLLSFKLDPFELPSSRTFRIPILDGQVLRQILSLQIITVCF